MPTVVELKATLKERGISGYSGKNKAELIKMLGGAGSSKEHAKIPKRITKTFINNYFDELPDDLQDKIKRMAIPKKITFISNYLDDLPVYFQDKIKGIAEIENQKANENEFQVDGAGSSHNTSRTPTISPFLSTFFSRETMKSDEVKKELYRIIILGENNPTANPYYKNNRYAKTGRSVDEKAKLKDKIMKANPKELLAIMEYHFNNYSSSPPDETSKLNFLKKYGYKDSKYPYMFEGYDKYSGGWYKSRKSYKDV